VLLFKVHLGEIVSVTFRFHLVQSLNSWVCLEENPLKFLIRAGSGPGPSLTCGLGLLLHNPKA
jgi:hypothetical protein